VDGAVRSDCLVQRGCQGSVRTVFACELGLSDRLAAPGGRSLMSALAEGQARRCSAVRKVHHPKIVQRSDGRWIVVCEDCGRERGSAKPACIGDPVESYEAAERIWEGHCERRIPPMRRGA
jgi:hypothetical protein